MTKIKPLVWNADHGCDATGLGIFYSMGETDPGLFALYSPFHSEKDLPKAEMQALAQRDYEARVLAEFVGTEPPSFTADAVHPLRTLYYPIRVALQAAKNTCRREDKEYWAEKIEAFESLFSGKGM